MACKEYCWWVLTLDGNVYVKDKNILINTRHNTNLKELSVTDLHTFFRIFSVYFMLKLKKYAYVRIIN